MSRSSSNSCPHCGASIPARASDRLCPACLLEGALEDSPEEDLPEEDLAESEELPREFGGYRLLSVLGSGGMGVVYEAEQIATARRVALKVLGHELDSPDTRQRFLREGRLAAGVNHPNSLYVYGTEEVDGRPVITMEIAARGTLQDKLATRGPLPVPEAVDAMLDVIHGLEAVFATGVLHRDIKPSNCFVSSDGSVKIGDFGLSVSTLVKDDSYLTGTGVIMGTPAFASPEQLRGRDVDVRSDIYSVGATLFALLTGKPPLEGRHPVEVVAAVLEETPGSLTELRVDVPANLAQVVARCLAKRPDQRYPDYAALRSALLPFGSTRPAPAPMGHRVFAGFLDIAICGLLPAVSVHAFFGIDIDDDRLFTERSATQVVAWIGLSTWFVVYFTVFEGIPSWSNATVHCLGKVCVTGSTISRPRSPLPPGMVLCRPVSGPTTSGSLRMGAPCYSTNRGPRSLELRRSSRSRASWVNSDSCTRSRRGSIRSRFRFTPVRLCRALRSAPSSDSRSSSGVCVRSWINPRGSIDRSVRPPSLPCRV